MGEQSFVFKVMVHNRHAYKLYLRQMMKLLTIILLCISLQLNSTAQLPPTYTSSDIYMQLKKLNVLGSILYIAAHPDDENNGLLPYFAKEKLYRTAYLSLTRGDGGQNLIGSEQGIELGMIRTQELLAAQTALMVQTNFLAVPTSLDLAKALKKHCKPGTKRKF